MGPFKMYGESRRWVEGIAVGHGMLGMGLRVTLPENNIHSP